MAVKALPFGTPVKVTRTLFRFYTTSPYRKFWLRTSADLQGVVIGVRTLSNGRMHSLGEDQGHEYKAEEHFRAYLVAYNLYRSPVLARVEDVVALEGEQVDGDH